MGTRTIRRAVDRWFAAACAGAPATWAAKTPQTDPETATRTGRGDRGDVPGWVMITMMTAIVVIVLLGVFQDAVVTAVKNAFDSISGQGTVTTGTGTGTP